MNSISGKKAIVTGGTRGIGRAICLALLERGASVVAVSRSRDDLNGMEAEYGDRYEGRLFVVGCDIRSADEVRKLFEEAEECFGKPDILINNAGVASRSYVENMSDEEWRSTLETNLTGVFNCSREAVRSMKQSGGGYIINIGSLAGTAGFAGGAAYCATKFGLIGFSESLMQEVRHDHIRVSLVMPGSVNTGFGRRSEQDPATTWKLWPEDVAEVVANLIEMEPRSLVSRVELRPAEPRK
jgi:NAD(P)-dependent dehydrogenase (short-subunit alcohol dehydrogenase family)